jgi:tetratricopeptide (TPR) repeat protein
MHAYLKRIKDVHQHVVKLITEKKLKEAFAELGELITKTGWELQSKLKELEMSYNYMLGYTRRNVVDPKRVELHRRLIRDALAIADRLQLQMIAAEPCRTLYFKIQDRLKKAAVPYTLENVRLELETYTENYTAAELPETENEMEQLSNIRKRHEEMQTVLFEMIWVSPCWTAEEEVEAKQLLESDLVSTNDLCLLVSAVTLSLVENFDRRKLLLLFDAYNYKNNEVNQRALVGLAIAFELYHTRLPYYPEINLRLSLLNEDETFAKSLNRVQIQILLSKETDKINKKMQEEIIPEMIKNAAPHNRLINPDENEEDFNPDWMQDIENSAFENKLREMNELQMEGADVYMSTFACHKGYPFFRTINNWFYPFDKQHSLVAKEIAKSTGGTVIDIILESAFFCDSDKYSLLFTLMQIPAADREIMAGQLSEQQIEELTNRENDLDPMKIGSSRKELISSQYIHNLYRFFKVYRHRLEFTDVFDLPIHLNEYDFLQESMYKPELFKELVDFLFRKEHYNDAIKIYRILLKLEGDHAETYQKLGYCYQKEKNYEQALEAYANADKLKPNNAWTNRHIASCYRLMTEYDKALFYYKKVEKKQPENRNLLYNIGSCLVELEQFDKAIQYFFKLDLIDPDNIKTWRAIAWCSFMLRKNEQAICYYDKIMERNGIAPDYLNAGHALWCSGNMKKAITLYTQSCKLSGSKSLFLDIFNKDKEYLVKNGINEYDIALMHDLL